MSIPSQTIPDTFETHESNVRSYSRQFPILIDTASGSTIATTDNIQYLDFFAGAGGLNYGHNQPNIKADMIAYLERDGIIHGLDMATEAKLEFIDAFVQHILEPRDMKDYKLQFTGPTGANAVEAAFKLARKVTGRTDIAAFTNGFHGVSLGALAATYNPHFRNAAGVELPHVTFLPYDDASLSEEASAAALRSQFEEYLAHGTTPAGVIVEAIQGEGGINVARPLWLQTLREITTQHNICLILDDIQAGCGRSGSFFAFEESGIKPDLVTLSKSISGSGLPMALLLIKSEFDIWKPAEHNGTFRGNNLAFVSAKTAIKTFWTDDVFVDEVRRKADVITSGLQAIVDSYPAGVLMLKGRGMMQGIEFANAEQAGVVAKYCFENNLIIERAGMNDEVVKLLPPLVIANEELEKGLTIISDAVKKTLA